MMGSEKQRKGPKEVQIPLPYGHMAAQEWGPPEGFPVLALHGWLDNGGSFDSLIPLLLPDLRIVALDFPGHGLSSHKPRGVIYEFAHFLVDIKRVVDFFSWKKFIIMGHSMGGGLGLLFASIYPVLVEKVISIDITKPVIVPDDDVAYQALHTIDQQLVFEKKQSPPVYTPDKALQRLINGLQNHVTEESAKLLMRRGTSRSSNKKGVIFNRDVSINNISVFSLTKQLHKSILENLNCELLIIKAKERFFYEDPVEIKEILDMYARNCKHFQYHEVEGTHFVHLNNPERVAPLINEFISKQSLNKDAKL
ncbi:serine hydrolase-like protein [Limulus polyphemus]|uniref:Serine hydrolase-like protein n=1 Tax=Limulus polyphemus TaxID=6850 RepID=A0ABM1BK36_LIMPO|nr:serine hydrolase-like protein [Limulus polyphemus]